jgi:oligogalacturonide transport system substrate-binding protein
MSLSKKYHNKKGENGLKKSIVGMGVLLKKCFAWLFKKSIFGQIFILLSFTAIALTFGFYFVLEDVAEFLRLSLMLWIGFVFFIMIIKIVLNQSFNKQLTKMEEVFKSIAVGDLSKSLDVNNSTLDIRQVSNEVNQAIIGLKRIISNINEQADTLHGASENLQDNSGQNKETFHKVIMAMQELASGTSEQAEHLSGASEKIKDLSDLIKKVTDDTENLTNDSKKLSDSAVMGQNISNQVNEQINTIYNSTQNIANVINELNKTSEEIGNMTLVIKTIAEQTSLLALNAAIEAARAGEHGRGFAVVAEETRNLAGRSMEATGMIKDLLDQMNKRNEDIIQVINDGVEKALEGKELAQNSSNRFQEIFQVLIENTQKIKEIAYSSKRITQNSDSVNETITNIAAFSEEIMASTQEVLAVSQEQNENTNEIALLSQSLNHTANALKQSISIYLKFSFFGNDQRKKETEIALNTYMEKNPYIKFKIEDMVKNSKLYLPMMLNKLKQGIASDLIQINQPWLPELKGEGDYFVDLYKEEGLDLSGFDKSTLEMCALDGNLMGLPTGMNAFCFHLNHDFCNQNNIPADTVWNWDNLLKIGAEVHKKNSNHYLLYSTDEFNMILIKMYIRQKTGRNFVEEDFTLGFNKGILEETYVYFKKLVDEGVLTYDKGVIRKDGTKGFKENDTFDYGKCVAMTSRFVSDLNKTSKDLFRNNELSIVMAPIAHNAKTSAIPVRPQLMLGINKKSDNVKEVIKFLNWIYNEPEGIRAWGTNRGSSPTVIGRKIQEEEKLVDPNVSRALVEAIEKGGSIENPLSNHGEILNQFIDMNLKVFEGKVTPSEGADLLMKKAEKTLKKLQKRSFKKK